MKVYDCFTFYNEFELLELRLKSLWNIVDYFVIVEANRTFANKPKDFSFLKRQDEFEEFKSKIRYIMVNEEIPFKEGTHDWSIEVYQRNAIMRGLLNAEADDLIFISDLDEIPNPNILDRLKNNTVPIILFSPPPPPRKENKPHIPCQSLVGCMEFLEYYAIAMEQEPHGYFLDFKSEKPWHGTVLVKYKNLTIPQEMRYYRETLPRVPNGGYHLSTMGGLDRVLRKMTATVEWADLTMKDPSLLNPKHVEECILSGKSILSDEVVFKKWGVHSSDLIPCNAEDIQLPFIKEFIQKYPQFLRYPPPFRRHPILIYQQILKILLIISAIERSCVMTISVRSFSFV